jgi:hypothetical protein
MGQLYGGDGNDYVYGVDGVEGNDFVSGGPGTNEDCFADSFEEIDTTTCENIFIQ